MVTTAFSEVLHRFVARYRARLLLKAAWLAALGLGVAAALAWRLHRLQVSPAWALGVPSLLGVVAAAALVVWLRRRWMARRGGAAFLDRTLGLQQRLVTAEEFADAATPPLLYPLLVEDVAHRVLSKDVRLPTPWDRTTLALTVLLLLLLLWPGHGGSVLQQLAQLPRTAPPSPRPEPPPQPEPPPPPQQGERQASGASQSQPGGSSGNQGEPSQQGQQSHLVAQQQRCKVLLFTLAADKRRRLAGQVVGAAVEALEWRECGGKARRDDLVNPLRTL